MREKFKSNKLLALFIFAILILFVNPVFACPPFLTTDPETLDPHTAEAFLYASIVKSKSDTNIYVPAMELDLGLAKNLEMDIFTSVITDVAASPDFREVFPNATGFDDVTLQLKYRFMEENACRPQMAIVPVAVLPMANRDQNLGNGRAWYQVPLTIEKSFNEWTTYAEFGYTHNPAQSYRSYLFGGWVIEKTINNKMMLGGEIYSQGTSSIYTKAYTLLNLGGRYKLCKDVNAIGSIGHSILGDEHWVAYLGLNWS